MYDFEGYKLKSNQEIAKNEELEKLQEKCKELVKSNKKLALIIIREWSKINFLHKFPIN
jgi:regulator of sirC expression with transglutaminase-like and TPR domain